MACDKKRKQKFDNFLDENKEAFESNNFGEDFKAFQNRPNEAIEHLLNVKRGQVMGAMQKEGIGAIDFVYGEVTDANKNKGYGLAHIVDKHGLEVAKLMPNIIEDSVISLVNDRRAILETQDHRVIVGLIYDDIDKVWLVSGFEMTDQAKAKSPALAKLKDMNAPSFTQSVANAILTNLKKKSKQYKKADIKTDAVVDIVWDTIMEGFDLAATPVKKILSYMNKDFDESKSWFGVTEIQKEANEIVNGFRNHTAEIYNKAGELKDSLDKLGKTESQQLVRALGGEIDAVTLPAELKDAYVRFRAMIDQNANTLVELGALDEKNKTEHYLKRFYYQYMEEHKNSSVAFSKLKQRKDLSLEERIAIGMREDASFVIPQTIAEQKVQIQKAQTLKQLADRFGVDEEIEGYIRISDESAGGGVKKWGAFAGKWVHPEVKTELDLAFRSAREMEKVERFLYPLIDHIKVNLTVKNPVTHVYNIASNMLLSGLNGDTLALGKVLTLRATDKAKFKELVQKANKHGLDSYLDDFEKAHIDLAPDGKSPNIALSIWKNLYMTQDSKLGAGARKLYDWEDKIFKLASFYKHLEAGVDETKAFKMASDVYVNYSTPLPAGIKTLDKTGLMPFLHYQYKSTPAVAKVMAKHPLRTILMGAGVFSLGASAWMNDDEEARLPEWASDKFNLFGVSEWVDLGSGWYLNAGRMIPGTKFEFEFGGILKGVTEIINGKTPLGYNIGSKYDEEYEKWGKKALTMAENYLPSLTLGRYMQRGAQIGLSDLELMKAKKNYYGEDMTLKELATRALGTRHFNEEKELISKLKSAKNRYKKMIKENPKDKKEFKKEYDNTARKIKAQAKEIGLDLSSAGSSDAFKLPSFKVEL